MESLSNIRRSYKYSDDYLNLRITLICVKGSLTQLNTVNIGGRQVGIKGPAPGAMKRTTANGLIRIRKAHAHYITACTRREHKSAQQGHLEASKHPPWKSAWNEPNSRNCWVHQSRILFKGCYQTSSHKWQRWWKRHQAQTDWEESRRHRQRTRMVSQTLLLSDTHTDLPRRDTTPKLGAGHDRQASTWRASIFPHSFSWH